MCYFKVALVFVMVTSQKYGKKNKVQSLDNPKRGNVWFALVPLPHKDTLKL